MVPGEDINRFIENSIEKADVVIPIISEKSLKSPWVIKEFIITSYKIMGSNSKHIIPCLIDKTLFDKNFIEILYDEIEKKIKTLNRRISDRVSKDRGFEDLQNELVRYKDFHHKLDMIINHLRTSFCLNFTSMEDFESKIDKLISHLIK